ncbi:MAG: hypothetical protein NT010_01815 [Proteobacteria bacterium]|nr:hypothetical protein [Pseudomonadota bacterium]
MGNEEGFIQFRRITISLDDNPAWMGNGMAGMSKMWMGCEACRP